MRGKYAIDSPAVKLAQNGLCNGAAGGGFCAAAKFVNQHQGMLVRNGKHLFHGLKERTVCA